MYPLLVKDGLSLPTWATLVLYLMLSVVTWWEEFRQMRKSLLVLVSLMSLSSIDVGVVFCVCADICVPVARVNELELGTVTDEKC